MCGAVNGMLLALSIKNGSSDPKDKEAKDSVYKDGQFLCEKFKKKNGSFICRELLGLSPLGQSQNYLRKNSLEGKADKFHFEFKYSAKSSAASAQSSGQGRFL